MKQLDNQCLLRPHFFDIYPLVFTWIGNITTIDDPCFKSGEARDDGIGSREEEYLAKGVVDTVFKFQSNLILDTPNFITVSSL